MKTKLTPETQGRRTKYVKKAGMQKLLFGQWV